VLHPTRATDVAAVAAELAAVQPEAIFLPLYEPECIAAVEAIRAEPRLAGAALLVAEGCQTAGFLRALGPGSDGVYSSGPDATGLDAQPFYRLEFLPAYQRLVDERAPITSSAATFDAVNIIFFAIRAAARPQPGGAIHIHREDLRHAMLTLTQYPGLSGTLGCSPLGDCVRSARMSIYRAPDWPVTGEQSRPVYSETLNLAEISQGL
jgi:ABC-type branched-subunit amino acid transport system substrate-binding protein